MFGKGFKREKGRKYGNTKVEYNGIKFDSKREMQRYLVLKDDLSQENGKKVLENLNKVLNGEMETLLLIEDPFGQSKIMDVRAKTEPLTDEELKNLKTGFTVIDE